MGVRCGGAGEVFNFQVLSVSCPDCIGGKISKTPTFGVFLRIFGNEKALINYFGSVCIFKADILRVMFLTLFVLPLCLKPAIITGISISFAFMFSIRIS